MVLWGPGPIGLDRLVSQACGRNPLLSDSSAGFRRGASVTGGSRGRLGLSGDTGCRPLGRPVFPPPCHHLSGSVSAAGFGPCGQSPPGPWQGQGAPTVHPPAGPCREPAGPRGLPPSVSRKHDFLPPPQPGAASAHQCQLPACPGRRQAACEQDFSGPRPRRGRMDFQSELRGEA